MQKRKETVRTREKCVHITSNAGIIVLLKKLEWIMNPSIYLRRRFHFHAQTNAPSGYIYSFSIHVLIHNIYEISETERERGKKTTRIPSANSYFCAAFNWEASCSMLSYNISMPEQELNSIFDKMYSSYAAAPFQQSKRTYDIKIRLVCREEKNIVQNMH